MRVRTTISLLGCLVIIACGRGAGPGAGLHQPKFSTVAPAPGATGHCVRDEATKLVWEVKNGEPGLHDWHNTYSWYNPEESHDELDYRGTADGGACAGSACDTWDLVRAVNAEGYCGFHDWRIPLRDELLTISDLTRAESPPTIDTDFFRYAKAEEYWSSNDYSFQYDAAWAWNFRYGHDRVDWKKSPKFVRLVRGEPLQLAGD